jgi:hypothetical protein
VETGENVFDSEEEIEFELSTNLCDVLDLDSIYQGRRVIECAGTSYVCEATEEDHAEINIAPSERALRILLDDKVLTPVALTTADALANIIFDTGASLAISLHRSDVVDDPTPLSRHTHIGGMEKGLKIEGVGEVACTFTAKDKSEIQLRVRAYYGPAAKARLLSPQKIFYKNTVSLVTFMETKNNLIYKWETSRK